MSENNTVEKRLMAMKIDQLYDAFVENRTKIKAARAEGNQDVVAALIHENNFISRLLANYTKHRTIPNWKPSMDLYNEANPNDDVPIEDPPD